MGLSALVAACRSLMAHPLRNFLTGLTVAAGTLTVFTVTVTTHELVGGVRAAFSSFENPGIFVSVDRLQADPQRASLRMRDVEELRQTLGPMATSVAPQSSALLDVSSATARVRVLAAAPIFNPAAPITLSPDDVTLSSDVARQLFPAGLATGKIVRLFPSNARLRIRAVVPSSNLGLLSNIFTNRDLTVPIGVLERVRGSDLDAIQITPAQNTNTASLEEAILQTLKRTHAPGASYRIQDASAVLQGLNNIVEGIQLGFMSIALISLVVSGLGITNLLLISMYERRFEIGVRRAVGASRKDIARQFIFEMLTLSAISAGVGILIAIVVEMRINATMRMLLPPSQPDMLFSALGTLSIALAISWACSAIPARQASHQDPTEILAAC